MNTNVLYNKDYREGIADIADGSIDLILTDPPYLFSNGNWHKSDKDGTNSILGKSKSFSSDGYMKKEMGNFGYEQICEMLDLVMPKMKVANAYFFCCEPQVPIYGQWAREHDLHFNILVWEKPLSIINKNRFSTNTEYLVRIYDFGTSLNRIDGNNDVYNKVIHTKVVTDKVHPTQKPISLMQRYVLLSSKKGDIVLDPFVGSGTTALACINTERQYICFEKDTAFYDIARKRIDAEARQLSLFNENDY